MAQKEFLSYPVTPEWCERVHEELERRGRGTQARLAEHLGVSTGLLAEHIGGKYQTSNLVEGIHQFFGWAAPLPPTASMDAGELIHGYARMTKSQREFMDRARRTLEGLDGEQAKRTLMEMLKLFRAATPRND